MWHSARFAMARVSCCPSSSRGTSAKNVFSRSSVAGGEPEKVFASALRQQRSTCHDTLCRTAGALWLACGSSAASTRAPASFSTKSPMASSASPPSHVFSPARLTSGGTRYSNSFSSARGSRNRAISRVSATASFAICERSESNAGAVASASWCSSGTTVLGWCTVSLRSSSRDSYCSSQFRSMRFAFEAFISRSIERRSASSGSGHGRSSSVVGSSRGAAPLSTSELRSEPEPEEP
mmetsp:Transcript_14340/g.61508  ORF Transcript_14340/g.61508 Transcript_14340/m.61508 type:complete len:237 (+) Transcript_14340:2268-2978(+)